MWLKLTHDNIDVKTKIVSRHTAYSKPVKQEVNGTMILPPLVFPAFVLALTNLGECNTYRIVPTVAQIALR
jgi:hypothetical protein